MIGSTIVAGEECILAIKSKGPDGTLDGVGVHLDAPVIREQDQAIPVVESTADSLGHFRAAGNEGQGLFEPGLELLKQRPALLAVFSGHSGNVLGADVSPRHELVDFSHGPAIDEA